ncbi:PPK2 family polyphosphate kinase [Nocardia sp. alder85J]|uniref:PPK2 family polyphosphate kinase n=1 Tax=Nocardia sp. alder85J TaxID=2862949 RepID=UPI001CD74759|nr:PPK2 family polyphosphate kinase [Nocardia sp. alder85J]MCX4098829.1 polyphosphate kinase 2 family protein [Nocardia sp. alder85J]
MAKTNWSVPVTEALRAEGVRVAEFDTSATPGFRADKKLGAKQTGELLIEQRRAVLADLQEKLYANGRSGDSRSVLLVLQGMDTSGKGGIVRHVIGSVDPQGVDHAAFGVPTAEERRHHYLWRVRRKLPAAGQLGVFDRSHYEDVLVVRVREMVPPEVWGKRFAEINAFERKVAESGTTIVKVALLISLEEQRKRLARRLSRPDKYWKFSSSDLDDRALLPAYQQAYQDIFDLTHTEYAPWYAVPADNKWYARLAVTELLVDALRSLELDWPPAHFDVAEQRARLRTC